MEWDNEGPVQESRHDAHYACLWAGDSRIYRLRSGHFQQLTCDHTAIVVEYAPAEEDETLLSRA